MQGNQPCNISIQQGNYSKLGSADAALCLRKPVISASGLEVRAASAGGSSCALWLVLAGDQLVKAQRSTLLS